MQRVAFPLYQKNPHIPTKLAKIRPTLKNSISTFPCDTKTEILAFFDMYKHFTSGGLWGYAFDRQDRENIFCHVIDPQLVSQLLDVRESGESEQFDNKATDFFTVLPEYHHADTITQPPYDGKRQKEPTPPLSPGRDEAKMDELVLRFPTKAKSTGK